MTQEQIVAMAREAGIITTVAVNNVAWATDLPDLERFAQLVAEHERDACAKVCDEIDNNMEASWKRNAVNCAAAIRARGEK